MRKIDELYYIKLIRKLRKELNEERKNNIDYQYLILEMIKKVQELENHNVRKTN